jgi:hypothetical protein
MIWAQHLNTFTVTSKRHYFRLYVAPPSPFSRVRRRLNSQDYLPRHKAWKHGVRCSWQVSTFACFFMRSVVDAWPWLTCVPFTLSIKVFDFGLSKELHPDQKDNDGTYALTGVTGSTRYEWNGAVCPLGRSVSQSLLIVTPDIWHRRFLKRSNIIYPAMQ